MTTLQNSDETYILFEVDGTAFGLPSRVVQQMEMIETITPVPNTPAFVEGVVFARGQVLPALNLRARFGLEKIPYDLRTRLVVASAAGRTVGLIVDTAREFVAIPAGSIEPPPEAIGGLSGEYLTGVARLGQRLVLLLNVEEIITFD